MKDYEIPVVLGGEGENTADDEIDVQVFESDTPTSLPWFAVEANGTVHAFATEVEACAFQREWRKRIGLHPISGEPVEKCEGCKKVVPTSDIEEVVYQTSRATMSSPAEHESIRVCSTCRAPYDEAYERAAANYDGEGRDWR